MDFEPEKSRSCVALNSEESSTDSEDSQGNFFSRLTGRVVEPLGEYKGRIAGAAVLILMLIGLLYFIFKK